MTNKVIFIPKSDEAAEWAFYPNQKTRKNYPDAELEFVSMECQDGEIISLNPKSTKILGDKLIMELPEGRFELIDFEEKWQEGKFDEDAIVWNLERIIEAWSSDE